MKKSSKLFGALVSFSRLTRAQNQFQGGTCDISVDGVCKVQSGRSMADASRDRMVAELQSAGAGTGGDASDKAVMVRGCDPRMSERAAEFLPPMLSHPGKLHFSTTDDHFFQMLREHKYDLVHFAPGACRWDAAGQPIPGGNAESKGWRLENYHAKVREIQGEAHNNADLPITGTTEESELVPIMRKALGLP